jgi:hypothetical protein
MAWGEVMTALKLSWETPFRWGASLLAIATVVSGGHDPVGWLAGAARYLWLDGIGDGLDIVDEWLAEHVADFALILPILLTLAVCGAYRGSDTLAEPRASSTFWIILALSTYAASEVVAGWFFLVVGIVIGFVVAHVRGLGGWAWLAGTGINVAFAGIWLPGSLVLWFFFLAPSSTRLSASARS